MRRKKRGKEPKELDIDANMQGTLTFKNPVNLRISGGFEGNLDTKGSLTISENAVVKADIIGETIVIAGKVTGDITATKELTLLPPALVLGDITTPKISITSGALLEGRCRMASEEKKKEMRSHKVKTAAFGENLLGTRELASYLEVEPSVVEEWATTGKIPAKRDGESWKFDKIKVDKWVADEKIKI